MKKRWIVGLCPLLAAMMCGPGDDDFSPPESDVCRMPAASADITTVRVRSHVTEATLVDGAELPITIGGQGSDMVGIELEVQGPDVPSCLAQSTTIDGGGGTVAESATPVNMYETDVADVWRSGTLWLFPMGAGDATVTTTVYGVTEEVSVTLTYDF